jgi:hypothetical protein
LAEAAATEARLNKILRASQQFADVAEAKREAERAWLRKHYPEVQFEIPFAAP